MNTRQAYLSTAFAAALFPAAVVNAYVVPAGLDVAPEQKKELTADAAVADGDVASDLLMKLNGKKLPYAANGAGVTVSINIDYSEEEYAPKNFCIYNHDTFLSGKISTYADSSQKVIKLEDISPGVYTIFLSFEEKTSHPGVQWTKCYVFDEDRNIDGDIELTLSPADAKNQFTGRTYLPGGEVARLDNKGYDDNMDPQSIPGNVNSKFVQTTIYDEKYDAYIVSSILGCGSYDMDNAYGPGIHWRLETKEDFFINDISDRFVICQQRDNCTDEGLVSTTAFSRGLSNMALENDWNSYTETTQFFEHTPAYDEYWVLESISRITGYGYGDVFYFPYELLWWNMGEIATSILYSTSANVADFPDAYPGYRLLMLDASDGTRDYNMSGQRIVFAGMDGAYEFTNFSASPDATGIHAIDSNGEEVYYDYPGHPALRIPLKDGPAGYVYGNSAPINTVNVQIYAREDGFVTMFTPEYRGLMGEIREADLLYLNATAYLNGEFAADMTTWNDFWSGVPGEDSSDVYTAVISNNKNVVVDGNAGYNVTSLEFSYGREDKCPPVIQILRVNDSQGRFSQYFGSMSEMKAYVCVGDYNWSETSEGTFYNYESNPVDLKVEIMRHGIEGAPWIELETSHVAENDNIAGYGLFFECKALESEAYETGWYDMRITAKDNAGNRNIQEFGPVFNISSETGVGSVDSGNAIECIGAGIYVAQDDAAEWKVYAIDGSVVYESIGRRVDLSSLPSGVYLLRTFIDGKANAMKIVR